MKNEYAEGEILEKTEYDTVNNYAEEVQYDYDVSPANKPHNTSSNTNSSSSNGNSNSNNGRSLYQNQSNTKASSLIKLKAKVLRRNSYDSSDVDDDSYSGTYVRTFN